MTATTAPRRSAIKASDVSLCAVPSDESVLLSVITLHIPGRERTLEQLRTALLPQIGDEPVEWLIHSGPNHYGTEMRRSSEVARGEYIAYVDDDDLVESNYIAKILAAIRSWPEYPNSTPDVVTFGSYSPGHPPCWLRVNRPDNSGTPEEGNVKTANHYCAWRREVAMSSPWLPRNYGAEYAWYTALRLARPELIEAHVHECLHIYLYRAGGTQCQDPPSVHESLANGGDAIDIYKHVDGRILMGKRREGIKALQDATGAIYPYNIKDVKCLERINYR